MPIAVIVELTSWNSTKLSALSLPAIVFSETNPLLANPQVVFVRPCPKSTVLTFLPVGRGSIKVPLPLKVVLMISQVRLVMLVGVTGSMNNDVPRLRTTIIPMVILQLLLPPTPMLLLLIVVAAVWAKINGGAADDVLSSISIIMSKKGCNAIAIILLFFFLLLSLSSSPIFFSNTMINRQSGVLIS